MSEQQQSPEQKKLTTREKLSLAAGMFAIIPLAILAYPDPGPPRGPRPRKSKRERLEEQRMLKVFETNVGVPYENRLASIKQITPYLADLFIGIHEDLVFRTASYEPGISFMGEVGKEEMWREMLLRLGVVSKKGDLIAKPSIHQFTPGEVSEMLDEFKELRVASTDESLPEEECAQLRGKASVVDGVLEHLGQTDLIIEINYQVNNSLV